jgi:hypothetical protein
VLRKYRTVHFPADIATELSQLTLIKGSMGALEESDDTAERERLTALVQDYELSRPQD